MLDITATDMDIAESNPLRYRGYYYDNETGYYYLQSRYYDPEIGRFISADSFDYIDTSDKYTTNAYAYCLNNPIFYKDSTGTEGAVAVGTALGWLFLTVSGLLLVYVLLEIIIGSIDGTSISIPSISIPSFSQATPAEKADAKIKSTIKSPNGYKYWTAQRILNYVTIGAGLSYSQALARARFGGDVFAIDANAAYDLAYFASGENKYPIYDKNKCLTGYYPHYHPNPRNGSHVFYI